MKQTVKADQVLVLVTMLAASGWMFTKFSMADLPPMGFIGLRFVVASLLLLPFAYQALRQLIGRQFRLAIMMGSVQAIGLLTWSLAINQSSQLSEGAFISSTLVLIAPLWGLLLYSQPISKEMGLAWPVAMAGLAMLALDGQWEYEPIQALYLMAAIIFALHLTLLGHIGKELPALPSTFIQLLTVGAAGVVASLLFESLPGSISSTTWVWLAAAVLLATSLRYFFMTWGFKHARPGNAAVIMLLEPVWTTIMSVVLFGEILTGKNMIGCVLILLALMITRQKQIRKMFRPGKRSLESLTNPTG